MKRKSDNSHSTGFASIDPHGFYTGDSRELCYGFGRIVPLIIQRTLPHYERCPEAKLVPPCGKKTTNKQTQNSNVRYKHDFYTPPTFSPKFVHLTPTSWLGRQTAIYPLPQTYSYYGLVSL